ncbi:Sfum_1244 family protein [Thermodesulfobacteriota bacterium]
MCDQQLIKSIQHNCNISDARDNGIYSICILVLKLRNLYKWEQHIEPWNESESSVLLDWISSRESYWETIQQEPYSPLPINGQSFDPFDVQGVNGALSNDDYLYGAGYGRSLKSIFFLARILERYEIEGCPVYVLGEEAARELASPFAMMQDQTIIIRREQVRYYFWDHLLEVKPSAKAAMQYALTQFDLLDDNGRLDRCGLIDRLDTVVDHELPIFIYHEVGEMQDTPLGSEMVRQVIRSFPDSLIEFFIRAVKDLLADTHEKGMIGYIVSEHRKGSLGFYISFLDGLRKLLFPEIITAFTAFLQGEDWQVIDEAREKCREKNLARAERIAEICGDFNEEDTAGIQSRIEKELLEPLGLGPQ